MIILVDMDDTIEQLLKTWVDLVNKKYDRHVRVEEVVRWDVSKAYPDLTREQVYNVLLDNAVWKEVQPVPGAAEALQRFIERGHEVFLVTATPYESIPGKMDGLIFPHFPFIDWEHVIITRKKQMIRGDVLIDDGFHNLYGGAYRKILVDAPYNRRYDAEAYGMIRVHSWEEIERVIEEMEREDAAEEGPAGGTEKVEEKTGRRE